MALLYIGFIAFVLVLLALDLGVFHRKAHVIGVREALGWSAFWIGLGIAFSAVIYVGYEQQWFGLGTGLDAMATPAPAGDGTLVYNDGSSALVKYLTGFVIEKSLAVDNLFVIAMIFSAFAVPAIHQHRVLFWGIAGALLMRGIMIAIGAKLITELSWIIYVFGAFLILTGIKMLVLRGHGGRVEDNAVVRLVRRWIPVTDRYHDQHFFVRSRGALVATPLFLALVLIEFTDLVFAVDSIPAIFAITSDPFLVFTSNVFAILGMRSLYFALAGMIHRFRYLKAALAIVLMVVGTKMIAHGWLKALLGGNFHFYVLAVIALILAVGVVASLRAPARQSEPHAARAAQEPLH